MTTSLESKSDLNTQELPTIPTIKDMNTWGIETLLRWIRQRDLNILEDDHENIFKKERIRGRAFLASTVENFKSYGLPLAVAVALKSLADEVNQEGKLLNQTAGRKRKRANNSTENEIDPPKQPISPKRYHREYLLSELATRANEQRKLVREMITDLNSSSDQHSNTVDPLPGAVAQLSNPQIVHTLPFPFVGSEVPVRFKLDKEAKVGSEAEVDDKIEVDNEAEVRWPYVGRTKFETLVESLKRVRKSLQLTTVWLYGTQGYGKSHLLAALVCYLAAQDERVVYIPDCRALLKNPVQYVRAAMLFAWANDIPTQKEIMTLNTEEEIEDFFFYRPEKVIFVIDQMNALKTSKRSEEAKKCADAYNWITSLTSRHKCVFSSSANYWEFHDQTQQQSSNLVVYAYGGLDRTEMDEWWKRHSDIEMTDDEKSDFEDITGRIPLLLDKCTVNGEIDLTADYLRDIYDKAAGFARRVRDRKMEDLSRWQWYYQYAQACIRRESVPSGYNEYSDLIDHRYFYRESDGRGNYTCGLVRNAVADQLLDEGVDFADTGHLPSLARSIDNKSITGTRRPLIHAVERFSYWRGNRNTYGVESPSGPFSFNDDFTDKPVLYRPKSFNFKAIDGIILLIKDMKKTKKKLMMFPLQITLAPATHADSRVEFFKSYGNWITDLSKFDVEVQFLWITPESRDDKVYPAGPDGQPPKHLERYISFKKVNKRLWADYEDAMKKLSKKKAAKREPPKETAAEGEPPKETAAKGKPPKKTAAKRKPPKETAAEGEPPKRRSNRLKR